MAAAGLRGTVITLRRNVGHQRAIAIGLNYCAEELPAADVLVMLASGGDQRRSSGQARGRRSKTWAVWQIRKP